MKEMKKSEFLLKKDSLKGLKFVKKFKNGNELYSHICNCPDCAGEGVIPYFAYWDSGVCYKCGGTGKIRDSVKVVEDAIADEKARKAEEARLEKIQKRIEYGYKEVDFKLKDWFSDVNLSITDGKILNFKYYLVIRETEKAVLIRFVRELNYPFYELWIPKKAIY